MTFGEYYAYDKEDSESQQLKELQSRDIVDQLYFSQNKKILKSLPANGGFKT